MVPDPSNRRSAVHGTTAVALLALSALAHYGYKVAPAWAQPDAQNICTAACFIAFCLRVAWKAPGWPVIWACAAWIGEELLRAGCSIAYLYRGAPATEPGDQCTGLMRLDLNYLGVFVLSLVLVSIARDVRVRI